MEAMASGKPVVAVSSGVAPELIQHNRTGLLVRPYDVHGLYYSMLRLAEDEKLRRRLGCGAREWVERNCPSSREVIKRLVKLYGEVLMDSLTWAV